MQFEDVARGIVATDGTAPFERHAGMAADRQFEFDDDRRRAQDRVDVAITLADDAHLGAAAGRELSRLGVGGEQDRQLIDLEGDEVGRVLGHVGIVGKDGGDRLADVSHLPARQHRLAVGLERGNSSLAKVDRRHVRNVGRRPDRDHAGQSARSRRVHRNDLAVGVVCANDPHVQLVREGNVAGEAAAASDQRRVLQPLDRLPDPSGVAASAHRTALILPAMTLWTPGRRSPMAGTTALMPPPVRARGA